jgi:hypothetical protein
MSFFVATRRMPTACGQPNAPRGEVVDSLATRGNVAINVESRIKRYVLSLALLRNANLDPRPGRLGACSAPVLRQGIEIATMDFLVMDWPSRRA